MVDESRGHTIRFHISVLRDLERLRWSSAQGGLMSRFSEITVYDVYYMNGEKAPGSVCVCYLCLSALKQEYQEHGMMLRSTVNFDRYGFCENCGRDSRRRKRAKR